MSTPASALPSAMQTRLDAMKNDAAANTPPASDGTSVGHATPAAAPTPPATPTTQTNEPAAGVERITLTRDEVNELKARAGKTESAEGRAAEAQLRAEELQHRLTELQASNKGSSTASAPAAPAAPAAELIDVSNVIITDEEKEKFGDSEEYINKLVVRGVAKEINRLLPELRNEIEAVKNQAGTVAGKLQSSETRSFQQQILKDVPDLQELIRHKHWGDFLDKVVPYTGGKTFDQVLGYHIQSQNAAEAIAVYKAFKAEYGTDTDANAGFAGASTGGGATVLPPDPNAPKAKLKMSDRKKASEDYRKGRITWDQMEEVRKAFEAADKEGNVDYNT